MSNTNDGGRRMREVYALVKAYDERIYSRIVELGSLVVIETGNLNLGARVEKAAMEIAALLAELQKEPKP